MLYVFPVSVIKSSFYIELNSLILTCAILGDIYRQLIELTVGIFAGAFHSLTQKMRDRGGTVPVARAFPRRSAKRHELVYGERRFWRWLIAKPFDNHPMTALVSRLFRSPSPFCIKSGSKFIIQFYVT